MAKDIIIQDEYYRANHMSGVTRLRTELEDGGVCYWIPEDEAVNLTEKTVIENGTYAAMNDDANGYSTVVVNVPNVFGEYDEGRVVKSGALVDQSSRTITVNGAYDTTTNNDVIVSVPNTYTQSDEGKVVSGSALVSQSSRTITVNGTYNTTTNNDVSVSVPNTYTPSDEGKVVVNSDLVSQSSRTITVNGTYDTTTNNSVSVETAGSDLMELELNENGIYTASEYGYDGFSEVTVSVPNTYSESDNGKVVNYYYGILESQESLVITSNAGSYDTTLINYVTVDIPNVYTEYDEGRVVMSGGLVDQTGLTLSENGTYDTTLNNSVTVETTSNLSTKTITVNGTYQASTDNVDGYSDVSVSVPNTYASSDEGKVVNNSELVSQSSLTITVNGTYDTTANNTVIVEIPSNLSTRYIDSNGLYRASDYGYDGFSEVEVEVETELIEPLSVIERNVTEYINSNVTNVGSYAFAGCSMLTYISLPVCGTIWDNAFLDCSSLQCVSVPRCSEIYSGAFYGCVGLQELYVTFDYCVVLHEDPFKNANVPIIYVASDYVSDYKYDAYWGLYSDHIEPYYEEENED